MGVGGIRWKKNKLEREKMGGKKRNNLPQSGRMRKEKKGNERGRAKNWTHTGLIIHTQ